MKSPAGRTLLRLVPALAVAGVAAVVVAPRVIPAPAWLNLSASREALAALQTRLETSSVASWFGAARPAQTALLRPSEAPETVAETPVSPATSAAPQLAPEPLLPPLDAARLLGDEGPAFAAALAAYKAGDFTAGDAALAGLHSDAATAAQWAGLKLHPREAGLARISQFLVAHPRWPAGDWLRKRAEEIVFSDHAGKTALAYFAAAQPTTGVGKLALARAFAAQGDFAGAGALVKDAWRNDDLGEALEGVVRKDFAELLTRADHKYRADRLLYAEKNGAALRAADLAGKDVLALARARAAANNDAANDALFAAVPPALQKDPGYTLAMVHMLRKRDRIDEAAALLLAAPRDAATIIDGDAWWTERRLVARKLLDRGDAVRAYRICADHAARSVNARVEADFHAGWIALRFLSDPKTAAGHFEQLAQAADAPIQLSRAAYWQGRAAEAAGDTLDAAAHYGSAAGYSTTFYGQMAQLRLGAAGPATTPLRPAPAAAQGEARDEAVRVVELLLAVGETELGAPLASDAAKKLDTDPQLAALAEVAMRRRDARMSLSLGKLLAHRGVAVDHAAFPSYGVPEFDALPGSAPRSVVFAIARQESAFDPKAISSAGAMGLMQMIPPTARRTAFQTGVPFDLSKMLNEPAFNAKLGAAHLGILLGEYKGSNLLTFAAYNAGGGRVKQWITAYGDPRRANVDPIDWVERIPIAETRNYVQRVMENYVVYRAKLGDEAAGPAPQVELAHAAP